MEENSCVVFVAEHTEPMRQGCKKCRTIIEVGGRFTIGIHITDAGRKFKYFLGKKDQPMHCGERKSLTQTFNTAEEAETEKQRIITYLNEKGSTEGLPLLWHKPATRDN